MGEDEAVVPLVAIWVVRKPGAAMPRQALLQLIAGAACQLPGGGVAGLDLQPQPGQIAAPVRPGVRACTLRKPMPRRRSSGRTQ